jgi:N-methylhydantoinase B/oxoprolinase/acetone carboxylase alpha subunit
MYFKADDSIQISVPFRGGFRNPSRRDSQKVLEDVLDGFTTVEAATSEYGVAPRESDWKQSIDTAVASQLKAAAANVEPATQRAKRSVACVIHAAASTEKMLIFPTDSYR